MCYLPNAEPCPRIVNGVIKWYCGDTFEISLELELEDQDGETVVIDTDDTVEVVFMDKRNRMVKTFTFTNVVNNTVLLKFDEDISALFPPGEYTYDVCLDRERRTTIANNNRVIVEC